MLGGDRARAANYLPIFLQLNSWPTPSFKWSSANLTSEEVYV
jgi:hypothetical protein